MATIELNATFNFTIWYYVFRFLCFIKINPIKLLSNKNVGNLCFTQNGKKSKSLGIKFKELRYEN